ncbi:MAG: two-CW domain-containing protein [Planctomycetota bacterium]|jgi:hypothetical protein
MNCWEFKKCGRQNGGQKATELGVCPAATETEHDSKNGGTNAGRYCWKVAGTLCGGKVQGSFASKAVSCMACDFLKQVQRDQGSEFIT